MRKKAKAPFIALTLCAAIFAFGSEANSQVVLSAWAPNPPTIDGIHSPGEWAAADRLSILDGVIEDCVFLVMNDSANLYIALNVNDPNLTPDDSLRIRFDNEFNGITDDGDDSVGLSANGYIDGNYDAASMGWARLDTQIDGTGVMGYSETGIFFEISKPLKSGDPVDFGLCTGDIIGFCQIYFMEGLGKVFPPSCNLAVNEQELYHAIRISWRSPTLGDSDKDGDVDGTDVFTFVNAWQAFNALADLNRDGAVGDEDIGEFAATFGKNAAFEDNLPVSYETYFNNHPTVADAAVNSLDNETKGYFSDYVRDLECTGSIFIEEPLELQNCNEPDDCLLIYPTDAEIKKITAAKTAHSIWMDIHSKVPWSLSDYSQDVLEGLYDLNALFNDTPGGYLFQSVVDHSPSQIYQYMQDADLIKGDPLSTLYAVIDDLRTTDDKISFLHGSTSYNDPTRTAYTLYEALTTWIDRGYATCRIARNGCHSMSRIMLGMLRSINIPGKENHLGEWFVLGHSSGVWPTLESVLPHGDDLYAGTLHATPTDQLLPTFSFYSDNQNIVVCGSDNTCLSLRHRALMATSYPDVYTTQRCCNPGNYGYASCEDYLSDTYATYLTSDEISSAVGVIENYCN